jgi:hypothetical protein
MNVYEKLVQARIAFQDLGVKMGGKNDYAGYNYYELSDILPAINRIAYELKFICEVSFADIATLTFRDTEKPGEYITFTSPMSTASLKGCHEVQNLGAVETYIKRYLYQNAFEIVEADALNKTHNPNEKPSSKPEPKTEARNGQPPAKDQCSALADNLKLSGDERKQMYNDAGQNYSNLLIMLKAKSSERDAMALIDNALDKVWEASK